MRPNSLTEKMAQDSAHYYYYRDYDYANPRCTANEWDSTASTGVIRIIGISFLQILFVVWITFHIFTPKRY